MQRVVTWVLQTDFRGDHNTEILKKALDAEGIPWVPLTLTYEDPLEVPLDLKKAAPMFYGSTALRNRALREFRDGVFFDPSRFEFETLRKEWGASALLNGDARVMSVFDFLASITDSNRNQEVFLRPSGDTKTLTGGVQARWRWQETLGLAMNNVLGPLPSTTIVVGTPKTIVRECRVFIVRRQAVAASTYRFLGESNTALEVPPRIWEFAENQARFGYNPAEAFVLDVCELDDGSLRIVEVNCLNCSGLYQASARSLVLAVTEIHREREKMRWNFSLEKRAGPCPHDRVHRCDCICHKGKVGKLILHNPCCETCPDCGEHLVLERLC